jgi:hypothetical protein
MTRTVRSEPRLALALIFLFIPSSLYAWAREGYEIVALIAEQCLQPEVREIVTSLLENITFVEASMWADRPESERQPHGTTSIFQ